MQHVHYDVFSLSKYLFDFETTLGKFVTHFTTPLCYVLVLWTLI